MCLFLCYFVRDCQTGHGAVWGFRRRSHRGNCSSLVRKFRLDEVLGRSRNDGYDRRPDGRLIRRVPHLGQSCYGAGSSVATAVRRVLKCKCDEWLALLVSFVRCRYPVLSRAGQLIGLCGSGQGQQRHNGSAWEVSVLQHVVRARQRQSRGSRQPVVCDSCEMKWGMRGVQWFFPC